MDNQTFNNYMVQWACERMVAAGYAKTTDEAREWLSNRRSAPTFTPDNSSFSERGAVKTLERVCGHAYAIFSARRRGQEEDLPARVKIYYTPHFKNLAAGKSFYASKEMV